MSNIFRLFFRTFLNFYRIFPAQALSRFSVDFYDRRHCFFLLDHEITIALPGRKTRHAAGVYHQHAVLFVHVRHVRVAVKRYVAPALFRRLQKEEGFSMLFIAHDLALVSSFCDRVGVMYRGKLVETAAAAELFGDPRHPYTRSLLAAVPLPDPRRARARKFVPYRPQEGENEGPLTEVAPGHFVRKGARG